MKNCYRTHWAADLLQLRDQETARVAGRVNEVQSDDETGIWLVVQDMSGLAECFIAPSVRTEISISVGDLVSIEGQVGSITEGIVGALRDSVLIASRAQLVSSASRHSRDNGITKGQGDALIRQFDRLAKLHIQQGLLGHSSLVSRIRKWIEDRGFVEFTTPVLHLGEGVADKEFRVVREHKDWPELRLPYSPQIFKQLLVVAGIDRYYQIATCFRRKRRPNLRTTMNEFRQLDVEMSFVEYVDIQNLLEDLICQVLIADREIAFREPPFPKFSYRESIALFGNDKPSLESVILPLDLSRESADRQVSQLGGLSLLVAYGRADLCRPQMLQSLFADSGFKPCWRGEVGGLRVAGATVESLTRDQIPDFRRVIDLEPLSVRKQLTHQDLLVVLSGPADLRERASEKLGSNFRKLTQNLPLLLVFAWVEEFPLFAQAASCPRVLRNPFVMPIGEVDKVTTDELLRLNTLQFDLVCNGVELASGGMRNHNYGSLRRILQATGHLSSDLPPQLAAVLWSMSRGAPPHGGFGLGLERVSLLLSQESTVARFCSFPGIGFME